MSMRASSLVHVIVVGAVVGAGAFAAGMAQPKADPPKPAAPAAPAMDPQQMMQEWMKLIEPGAPHASLKKMEGDWTTSTKIWMDPKAPPMESAGKATMKMVLGGRFLRQDFDGTMMGMPMQGMGMTGFDNNRRVYVGTWADSMNTAILSMTGGISPDGKTITMFGAMDEPSTKEVGKIVKWVTRLESDDRVVFEAWEVQYGDPFKVFEITYTRVKK